MSQNSSLGIVESLYCGIDLALDRLFVANKIAGSLYGIHKVVNARLRVHCTDFIAHFHIFGPLYHFFVEL